MRRGVNSAAMTTEVGIFPETKQTLDIFPIGTDATKVVAAPIFTNLEQSWDDYLEEVLPMLDSENPYANDYLMRLGDVLEGNLGIGFKVGVALAYEVLIEKAISKGTQLPVLSMEFVEMQHIIRLQRTDLAYGKIGETRNIRLNREEEMRRQLFVMVEKDAYQMLDEVSNDDEPFFENVIFVGFVSSYFLFAEGFNDPSYWEE